LPSFVQVKREMFNVVDKTTEWAEKTTWERDEAAITHLAQEAMPEEPLVVEMLVADMNR
ncbi:unnamed protein product, partial [Symbiodinium pilosum]